MDYKKIYEDSLDAPLQSVEDGLPVRESLSVEMFRTVFENGKSHLQEMANFSYDNGLTVINTYTKSSNENTLRNILTFLFLRQIGVDDGVKYLNEEEENVSVDVWFDSLKKKLDEKADISQKKSLNDLKLRFDKTLSELRKNGWRENTAFSDGDRLKLKNVIDNVSFSTIV
jgi:hypothetical protein